MIFSLLQRTNQIAENQTPQFCKDCGACCNKFPGGYSPDQFTSIGEIKELIEKSLAIIDYWICDACPPDCNEGCFQHQAYYLRPRNKEDEDGVLAGYIERSPCVRLGPHGCELEWKDRPHGCRALRATAKMVCASIYKERTKKLLSEAWEASDFDLRRLVYCR